MGAGRRNRPAQTRPTRNKNTRTAYVRAVAQFCAWCERHGVRFEQLQPMIVAAYIESHPLAAPTVKQHLAAIRMLCDYLVVNGVLRMNPAAAVRGPKHSAKRGKTPVLTGAEARAFLEAIETKTIVGLRDRAIVAVMVYTFGRVGAVSHMHVEDYYPQGKRWWFRLHEKGGKRHELPAHHLAEAYVDAYLDAAGVREDRKGWLFRSVDRRRKLTNRRLSETDVLSDDQAAGRRRRRARQHVLPHVPGDRDHGLPAERRHARKGAADRQSRVAAHDEALRPQQRHADARRDRTHHAVSEASSGVYGRAKGSRLHQKRRACCHHTCCRTHHI